MLFRYGFEWNLWGSLVMGILVTIGVRALIDFMYPDSSERV